MSIQRNKNLAGRRSNMVFGALTICDGAVRVLSLGFLHTTWVLDYSRYQAKLSFARKNTARNA